MLCFAPPPLLHRGWSALGRLHLHRSHRVLQAHRAYCARARAMTQGASAPKAAAPAAANGTAPRGAAQADANGAPPKGEGRYQAMVASGVDPARAKQLMRPSVGNTEDDADEQLPFMGKLSSGGWGPLDLYGTRIPERPLLKVLRNAVRPQRLWRIEQVLLQRCARVTCLFENLSDPANGAACLRTMESFGLAGAHAVEAYERFRVSTSITKSADKWMELDTYRHCDDAAAALRQQGYTLVATCLDKDAVPLTQVDFGGMPKVALLFGNEERGLSRAMREAADVKVYVEMVGFTQSFNVSVSCALLLMHLRAQGVITPDLSDEQLAALYEKWLIYSTKKAVSLLKRHGLEHEVSHYM